MTAQDPKRSLQHNESNPSTWKTIYRLGALAALLALLVFRRNFSVELTTFNGLGIFEVPAAAPTTSLGWFELFKADPLVGLLLFDLVDLINYALVGLIFLALYGALRKANRITVGIALALGVVGITVYFASNQTFAMHHLSQLYAKATTEAQQLYYLSAGGALLAIHNPGSMYQGTGMHTSLFLVLLAGLIFSIVMHRGRVFSRAAAWTGIIANSLTFLSFLFIPLLPELAWIPPTTAAPFRLVWYFLIALKLFALANVNKGRGV